MSLGQEVVAQVTGWFPREKESNSLISVSKGS